MYEQVINKIPQIYEKIDNSSFPVIENTIQEKLITEKISIQ